MSWDAYLYNGPEACECRWDEPCPHTISRVWNYTHNCNRMIAAALESKGVDVPRHWLVGPTWWDRLDGMSGPNGAAYLNQIIHLLESDPERYRAMNPDNGWGDYDSLVKVLTEMRNAVPEWPTTWSVHG